jgi:NADH:ubiquinone oxidoreductase subunit 6 (subunit J)
MEQKVTPVWMKALVICLISIVFTLVIYFAGQLQNRALGWVGNLIFFAGVIWSCIQYAKQMHANVTFGNVFAHGFKVSAAYAAIMAIYTIVAIKFIYPEIIDLSLDTARKEMEDRRKMTDEQITQALDITRRFFVVFGVAAVILFSAIVGAIASLIGAAVAKKNPNPLQEQ